MTCGDKSKKYDGIFYFCDIDGVLSKDFLLENEEVVTSNKNLDVGEYHKGKSGNHKISEVRRTYCEHFDQRTGRCHKGNICEHRVEQYDESDLQKEEQSTDIPSINLQTMKKASKGNRTIYDILSDIQGSPGTINKQIETGFLILSKYHPQNNRRPDELDRKYGKKKWVVCGEFDTVYLVKQWNADGTVKEYGKKIGVMRSSMEDIDTLQRDISALSTLLVDVSFIASDLYQQKESAKSYKAIVKSQIYNNVWKNIRLNKRKTKPTDAAIMAVVRSSDDYIDAAEMLANLRGLYERANNFINSVDGTVNALKHRIKQLSLERKSYSE